MRDSFFRQLSASGRIAAATIFVCCVLYTLLILGIGRAVNPKGAEGSLVFNGRNEIIGSELIAQRFTRPEYLWPRPSAVGYNASASGGSNLSPDNPEIRDRAIGIIAQFGDGSKDIPSDLATASGSGLDPHISLKGAEFQIDRIAQARGISSEEVKKVIIQNAKRTGSVFEADSLVNVLLVNLELDKIGERHE
jgi:potassium-transporting ATPase KdpC subunit